MLVLTEFVVGRAQLYRGALTLSQTSSGAAPASGCATGGWCASSNATSFWINGFLSSGRPPGGEKKHIESRLRPLHTDEGENIFHVWNFFFDPVHLFFDLFRFRVDMLWTGPSDHFIVSHLLLMVPYQKRTRSKFRTHSLIFCTMCQGLFTLFKRDVSSLRLESQQLNFKALFTLSKKRKTTYYIQCAIYITCLGKIK